MTDNVAAAISRILVVAGSEAGRWNGWYAKAIPLVEGRVCLWPGHYG